MPQTTQICGHEEEKKLEAGWLKSFQIWRVWLLEGINIVIYRYIY